MTLATLAIGAIAYRSETPERRTEFEKISRAAATPIVASFCDSDGDSIAYCYLRDFDQDGHVDAVVVEGNTAILATKNARQYGYALYDQNKRTQLITPEIQIALDRAYRAGLDATAAITPAYRGYNGK